MLEHISTGGSILSELSPAVIDGGHVDSPVPIAQPKEPMQPP